MVIKNSVLTQDTNLSLFQIDDDDKNSLLVVAVAW